MIVNDRNLAVEVDGSGPAVLFLHGLGGTSNFYQPQAEALAEHFQPSLTRSRVTGHHTVGVMRKRHSTGCAPGRCEAGIRQGGADAAHPASAR